MSYGVLSTGYTPKTFTIILAELQAALRAQFGQSINVSPQSVYGQLATILGERDADLWDALGQVFAGFSPDSASGAALDYLCALTGVTRKSATYSTVSCTLTGTAATVIPAGSVVTVTGTGSKFALQANVTLNGGGTGTGSFKAVSSGPVVAAAGSLVTIATPVFGWSTVTNAADAIVGTNVETDAELRARREAELALGGAGTLDSIRAKILALAGVNVCTIFENAADLTDSDGRPPHSYEVMVGTTAGFVLADLLAALWATKPAGIALYGAISGSTTDSQGNSQTVKYSTPTEKPVYAIVNLTVDASKWNSSSGPGDVEQAMVDYAAASYVLGKDVVASALLAQAFKVAGVLDGTVLIGFSPSPVSSTTLAIGPREFASLTLAHISVSFVNGTP